MQALREPHTNRTSMSQRKEADTERLSVRNMDTEAFLLPEIFELVLDALDGLSSHSLLDYVHLMSALGNTCLQGQLGERLELLNFTANSAQQACQTPCTRVLASGSGVLGERSSPRKKRTAYLVDERADFEHIESTASGPALDLVYCGDEPHLSEFVAQVFRHISQGLRNTRTYRITVDLPTDTLYGGSTLFGILGTGLMQQMTGYAGQVSLSFPQLKTLKLDYLALDSFIYQVFQFKEREVVQMLDAYLEHIRWHMPALQSVVFTKRFGDREEETCNFIDLSTLMLNKFLAKKVKLSRVLQVHSFPNWDIPNIRSLSGLRFKFDEAPMTGSPERMTVSLRENVSLLREMAKSETIDAAPYYRLELIPRGVTSVKILNWIPMGEVPVFILKSATLESLELSLLDFRDDASAAITIQGLYLPRLKFLRLQNSQQQQAQELAISPLTISSRSGAIIMTAGGERTAVREAADEWPAHQVITPVNFSSWNELCRCEIINVAAQQVARAEQPSGFIFSIRNLRSALPTCNLRQSFEAYLDDRQRFVVV